jgi:hypothetical protein
VDIVKTVNDLKEFCTKSKKGDVPSGHVELPDNNMNLTTRNNPLINGGR